MKSKGQKKPHPVPKSYKVQEVEDIDNEMADFYAEEPVVEGPDPKIAELEETIKKLREDLDALMFQTAGDGSRLDRLGVDLSKLQEDNSIDGLLDASHHKDDNEEDAEIAPEDDPQYYAFGGTVQGNQVTIQAGLIVIQGNRKLDYAGATYTATGSYCYPTVKIPITDPESFTIEMLAYLATPDSTNYYRPLIRLREEPVGSGKYVVDGKGYIYHRGIIDLTNPLVFG